MVGATSHFPKKLRELQNHHMDSTVWNEFKFREGDIIVGTYAKSGTTWTQQIIGQLINRGREDVDVAGLSPWLDMRILPRAETLAGLEAQTGRRFIKTHLPADALVMSPLAQYVYIARDGRDVVWSAHNHFFNAKDELFDVLNNSPNRVGPPLPRPPADVVLYFEEWLEGDGYPLWSFWENIRTWWNIRHHPRVRLIHFQNLKDDLKGSMQDLAGFLDIRLTAEEFAKAVEHSTFDYMKTHAERSAPLGGIFWEGGAKTFINKGSNGRWRDALPKSLSDRYEALAVKELGRPCAEWLAKGGRLSA